MSRFDSLNFDQNGNIVAPPPVVIPQVNPARLDGAYYNNAGAPIPAPVITIIVPPPIIVNPSIPVPAAAPIPPPTTDASGNITITTDAPVLVLDAGGNTVSVLSADPLSVPAEMADALANADVATP